MKVGLSTVKVGFDVFSYCIVMDLGMLKKMGDMSVSQQTCKLINCCDFGG